MRSPLVTQCPHAMPWRFRGASSASFKGHLPGMCKTPVRTVAVFRLSGVFSAWGCVFSCWLLACDDVCVGRVRQISPQSVMVLPGRSKTIMAGVGYFTPVADNGVNLRG